MTRYIAVLFVLLATHAIDARETWPPKDGLGHDLPKELSQAYRYVAEADPKKFPHPNEVQTLLYDFDVRSKFWFMTGRMMELAKRGNGRVLAEDEEKFKAALDVFLEAIFTNRRFARMSKLKQRQIAKAMSAFSQIEITARVIYIHSLAEIKRYRQKKNDR